MYKLDSCNISWNILKIFIYIVNSSHEVVTLPDSDSTPTFEEPSNVEVLEDTLDSLSDWASPAVTLDVKFLQTSSHF